MVVHDGQIKTVTFFCGKTLLMVSVKAIATVKIVKVCHVIIIIIIVMIIIIIFRFTMIILNTFV